ncbi:MAG: hypothetical protein VKM34_04925 [Cyanobacteriota bacterium]|nr:hypothetical protein [Cyanobacteriota bacterium]
MWGPTGLLTGLAALSLLGPGLLGSGVTSARAGESGGERRESQPPTSVQPESGEHRLPRIEAQRCQDNPLIQPGIGPGVGVNINGPSVIRTPEWLPGRLGRYYLYFASHRGRTIRLAYADDPCGPWTLHPPGTLRLSQARGLVDHIASPDVHVDDARREIRMYLHGRKAGGWGVQRTGLAISSDGLQFRMVNADLGSAYFRVFPWGSGWMALAKQAGSGGRLYRARFADGPFVPGAAVLPTMRHAAVLPWGDGLLVFHSRIGDAPERILVVHLGLNPEGGDPVVGPSAVVLSPDTPEEGNDQPLTPSRSGATRRARQLRDPAILVDGERTFLFYALAGESGIGAAELRLTP